MTTLKMYKIKERKDPTSLKSKHKNKTKVNKTELILFGLCRF